MRFVCRMRRLSVYFERTMEALVLHRESNCLWPWLNPTNRKRNGKMCRFCIAFNLFVLWIFRLKCFTHTSCHQEIWCDDVCGQPQNPLPQQKNQIKRGNTVNKKKTSFTISNCHKMCFTLNHYVDCVSIAKWWRKRKKRKKYNTSETVLNCDGIIVKLIGASA